MLENRYFFAALFIVLMVLSAVGGYQFHIYQEKQAMKSFFGAQSAVEAQKTASFFDMSDHHHSDTK